MTQVELSETGLAVLEKLRALRKEEEDALTSIDNDEDREIVGFHDWRAQGIGRYSTASALLKTKRLTVKVPDHRYPKGKDRRSWRDWRWFISLFSWLYIEFRYKRLLQETVREKRAVNRRAARRRAVNRRVSFPSSRQ